MKLKMTATATSLLLCACGPAEERAGPAAAKAEQPKQVARVQPPTEHDYPPPPTGLKILPKHEVDKVMDKTRIVTAARGHIGTSWEFETETGKVLVNGWGGIVPFVRYSSYRIYRDGSICIPAEKDVRPVGCLLLARSKPDGALYVLEQHALTNLEQSFDKDAWRQSRVRVERSTRLHPGSS